MFFCRSNRTMRHCFRGTRRKRQDNVLHQRGHGIERVRRPHGHCLSSKIDSLRWREMWVVKEPYTFFVSVFMFVLTTWCCKRHTALVELQKLAVSAFNFSCTECNFAGWETGIANTAADIAGAVRWVAGTNNCLTTADSFLAGEQHSTADTQCTTAGESH